MKVLKVIHGYPPFYMAGSEVYSYNLTKELSRHADVHVFTRVENPFEEPYSIFDEVIDGVKIRRVNKPGRDYTLEDKYLDLQMDERFREHVEEIGPDVVHVGHLSHLSTNIINIAKEEFGLPVIYTIHDFWLFCFRGQAIKPGFETCAAPSPGGCLECAREKFKDKVAVEDMERFGEHMKRVRENVDIYLSPSMFLKDYFEKNGITASNLRYSRYGFRTNWITWRDRTYTANSVINFGFMGRVIPTKGIHILLKAFGKLGAMDTKSAKNAKNGRLLMFGDVGTLRKYLNGYVDDNVIFRGGYKNWEIDFVLDEIDVLVVPSLWYENSPLVIQEAFLAGIPVITSDLGGMKELPQRESVRTIEDDAAGIMDVYREVLDR